MRVLALGCGEMGRVAIEDLVMQRAFAAIGVATRHPEVTATFLDTLDACWTTLDNLRVDVQDHESLVRLMREYDVVCNTTGPNYRNAVPVVRAAIAAGRSMVDLSDDWEATLEILDLHEEAKSVGITVIVGMGASPGVTNVLARAGADKLDRTDEVHTAWVMRGSDPGGLALAYHLLYSLPHRAFVFQGGAMREVAPFVDGLETLNFPSLGDVEVFHIGHPEPFTLSRFIEGVRYADDKATFLPAAVNDLIRELGDTARAGVPVMVEGYPMDAMDFAAGKLHRTCKAMTSVPRTAALRTEVVGELEGRRTHLIYTSDGTIGVGTGIPAAIATHMLAEGRIRDRGVFPPEAIVDPQAFHDEVMLRGIGNIYEEIIQE